MKFSIEQRFDVAADEVIRALSSAHYLGEVFSKLPDIGAPIVLSTTRSNCAVQNRLQFAFSGQLPSVVTSVIDSAKLIWVEQTTIDLSARHASFTMTPVHYRSLFSASGTWSVTATNGNAAKRTVSGSVKVNSPLPFTSGKVESAIVRGLNDRLALEPALLESWVAANPRSATEPSPET